MPDYTIDREELSEALRRLSDRVQKNTTIVTPDDVGSDFLYHITLGKNKEFVPNISRRAGDAEDNTVPRVHVSLTLNDAWNGYAGGGWLVANKVPSKEKSKGHLANYKGGFYIYRLPFRAALAPNTKLVYDANFTKEHWLVTYNEMTRVFLGTLIGTLICESVTYLPRLGKLPIEITTLLLEVDTPEGISISKSIRLKKGYYRYKTSEHHGVTDVMEISKSEFLQVKGLSAAMLSHEEPVPKFLF